MIFNRKYIHIHAMCVVLVDECGFIKTQSNIFDTWQKGKSTYSIYIYTGRNFRTGSWVGAGLGFEQWRPLRLRLSLFHLAWEPLTGLWFMWYSVMIASCRRFWLVSRYTASRENVQINSPVPAALLYCIYTLPYILLCAVLLPGSKTRNGILLEYCGDCIKYRV